MISDSTLQLTFKKLLAVKFDVVSTKTSTGTWEDYYNIYPLSNYLYEIRFFFKWKQHIATDWIHTQVVESGVLSQSFKKFAKVKSNATLLPDYLVL